MVDRYTKVMLTVIAMTLVWNIVQTSIQPADAQRFGSPVLIAGFSKMAAECLAGHITYTKGDTGTCIAGW